MERGWLEEIRRSSESRKNRWIVSMSMVTLILVSFVWLKYFNFIVQPVDPVATQSSDNFSFWDTTKGGMAVISEAFKERFGAFMGKINESRSYTVSPSSQ